jgi:hypothetical protein
MLLDLERILSSEEKIDLQRIDEIPAAPRTH